MEEFVYDVLNDDSWWWSRGRRALIKALVGRYAGNGNGNRLTRILDIGCGTGTTMKELEAYAPTVCGLDISPAALRYCSQRGISSVSLGDASVLPFRDGQFDVVISVDLLEHMEDDVGALREMHRVAKPGGVVIATVPAFQQLWSRRDEQLHHKRRYTKELLQRKVAGAGFGVQRATYINLPLLLPLFLLVQAGRLFSRRPIRSMDHVLVPRPVNEVLSWVVEGEARWLARADLPIGVSIACVATKGASPGEIKTPVGGWEPDGRILETGVHK